MRAVVPSPVTATDAAWPQTRGATPPTRVTARANLEHSLPFLVAGVLMVGVGAWFGISHLQPAGSRGAFWLLVVGLGVTLTGGGLALTLSEPPNPASGPTPYGDYVLVPRGDWVRWQQEGFGVPSGPPAPPAPAETPVWQETEPEAPASQTVAAPATPATDAPPSAPEVPGAPTYPATSPSLSSAPHDPNDSALVAQVSEELLRAPRHPWVESRDPPASPTAVPAWQEDAIQRLEAEVAAYGREPPAPPPPAAAKVPSASLERCISCGGATTTYSEQVCVMCDRPLCDACLEKSVADGRPSVCPYCNLPDRT